MRKVVKYIFIFSGFLVFIGVPILFAYLDIASVWDSWLKDENGKWIVKPDIKNYILLIVYKLSLYLFPPLLFSVGKIIENNDKLIKNIYRLYFIRSLNCWFLVLLITKLTFDSIFELDRIFSIKIFDSIKDVQVLIGYVATVVLKKEIKIDPNKIYEIKEKKES